MAGNDSLNASVIHGGVRYLSSALRATLSRIFASLSQRGWLSHPCSGAWCAPGTSRLCFASA